MRERVMASSPLKLRRPERTTRAACYSRYQSDAAVAQYCDAHYGPDKFGVANFPARLAELCTAALAGKPQRRALDLGCAVGRASFELATRLDHVTGIDISDPFIALARRLQKRGRINYRLPEEGDLISDQQVRLADLGLAATASRVAFHQGNVLQLDEQFTDYDLVLAANLIDRLPDPRKFLSEVHRLLASDGLLAIASPYTWLDHYTPRRRWLGGRFRAGAPMSSLEGLRKKLAKHFTAVGEPQEVEFVIRENARMYQHYISQLTLWRRVR
jgi:putative 4-mercaptohistidine N1-methyltranferase